MKLAGLLDLDCRADDIARTLDHAHISPVLTAHPTEVQRKSILDAERAIAELVGQRDSLHTEREKRDNENLIRARITQLWQTRMLRYSKLTVADEIENALSYYPATFLRELRDLSGIPALVASLQDGDPGIRPTTRHSAAGALPTTGALPNTVDFALRKVDDLNELSGSELQAVRAASISPLLVE